MRSRLRDERGHSLIELIAGMGVAAVVAWAAIMLTLGSTEASTQVAERTDAAARARLVLDRMATTLSSQVCVDVSRPPISEGTPTSVTFYTHLGDQSFAPAQHRLAYDAASRRITETIWQPVGTPPEVTFPGAGETRILAERVEPGAGGLFRYFGFTPLRPTTATVEFATPLNAADASRVIRVALSIKVLPDRRRGGGRAVTIDADAFVGSLEATTDPGNGPRCT